MEITPDPLRTFYRSEPVFIYLEVYNLTRDEFGRTQYDISYRIGRPGKGEIDPALFVSQDPPEAGARVEIEAVVPEKKRIDFEDADEDAQQDRRRTKEDVPEAEPEVHYRVRYVLPERNRISQQSQSMYQTGEGVETAVTARYEGDRKDDFTYLQIDIAQVPVGVHKLTVTVVDIRTGQTAERGVLFLVVE